MNHSRIIRRKLDDRINPLLGAGGQIGVGGLSDQGALVTFGGLAVSAVVAPMLWARGMYAAAVAVGVLGVAAPYAYEAMASKPNV